MLLITHAALGAVLAEIVPGHPMAAFALGMASHFLVDIIPHGDSKLYKGFISGAKKRRAIAYVTTDAIVTLFFVLFLFNTEFYTNRLTMTLGIIGGVLPDLLVGLYELARVPGLRWFHRVHFFFHNLISSRKGDIPLLPALGMQAAFIFALATRWM
jgi:hypothetical protein